MWRPFKDKGVEGWKEGGGGGGGVSNAQWGSNTHYCHLVFSKQEERGGV